MTVNSSETGRACHSAGRGWLAAGAVLAGLAVAAGAFGAHGLHSILAEIYDGQTREVAGQTVPAAAKYLADFKTGAQYQMYHALALVAVGLVARNGQSRILTAAGWCFLLGIVGFSGSLYLLPLTGQRAWGMVAPIGGSLMIVGWFLLAGACCCRGDA